MIAAACNTWPAQAFGRVAGRTEAPEKYFWIEHAERNAIYLAARQGISTNGARMFVDLTPCVDCARAIIQAGIAELAINKERSTDYDGAKYFAEQRKALNMLAEADVAVRLVSTKAPVRN